MFKDNKVGMILIEPLLLLTICVIMSQSDVQQFFASHIDKLNPDESGNISLIGMIIYGAILVIVFMASRKLIETQLVK